MSDFKSDFNTSVKEVFWRKWIADVAEIAKELELEPKEVTELLQSLNKIRMNKDLFCMEEKRKQFLDIETTPGKDTVKIIEMTIKDLEHYSSGVWEDWLQFWKKFYCR